MKLKLVGDRPSMQRIDLLAEVKNGCMKEGGHNPQKGKTDLKNKKNESSKVKGVSKGGKSSNKFGDIRNFFVKASDPKIESLRANFALKKGQTSKMFIKACSGSEEIERRGDYQP